MTHRMLVGKRRGLASIAFLASGALMLPVGAAEAVPLPRVTICHATAKGFVTITVPIDYDKGNGHLTHSRDIVPGPDGDGRNWDAEGAATLLNGCVRTQPVDTDRDGVWDVDDSDDDGDGVLDARDLDDDGDGIADGSDDDQESKRDTDRDGVPNSVDEDDDGDGIADVNDTDRDGDAVPDAIDRDIVPLADTDRDGVPDATDPDDDGDCVADAVDADRDGDLIPDAIDRDLDNDGIPNADDADDDGDGTPDVVDPDADGDSVDDVADAPVAVTPPASVLARVGRMASDAPLVGLCQPSSNDKGSSAGPSNPGTIDTDKDGTPDSTDVDDDADGIPDTQDGDDDGDGIADSSDGGQTGAPDADRDGVPDAVDSDDDGDGLVDAPSGSSPTQPLTDPSASDSDGDGQPNSRDNDDDGDGVLDTRDGDADGDGVAETVTQVLRAGQVLPRVLRDDGSTVLLAEPAITNARQLATVSVNCASGQRTPRAKPLGDVRPAVRTCAVRKIGDRLVLTVQTDGPTAVTVRLSAAARAEYRAVEQVRTYVIG